MDAIFTPECTDMRQAELIMRGALAKEELVLTVNEVNWLHVNQGHFSLVFCPLETAPCSIQSVKN